MRAVADTRIVNADLCRATAALDAETEHALFERYAAAVRQREGLGAITVLVSHRFSTVRDTACPEL